MREHRKMTLKRIGIGILCMVFVLSMLAPLVAFAEEKTEQQVPWPCRKRGAAWGFT